MLHLEAQAELEEQVGDQVAQVAMQKDGRQEAEELLTAMASAHREQGAHRGLPATGQALQEEGQGLGHGELHQHRVRFEEGEEEVDGARLRRQHRHLLYILF